MEPAKPVDKEKAIFNLDGDEDFLIEIWQVFLEEVDSKIKDFTAAVEKGDSKTVHLNAHSIKSVAARVGAFELSVMSAELERYAKEENWEQILLLYPTFQHELQRVVEFIQAEFSHKEHP